MNAIETKNMNLWYRAPGIDKHQFNSPCAENYCFDRSVGVRKIDVSEIAQPHE